MIKRKSICRRYMTNERRWKIGIDETAATGERPAASGAAETD